MLTGDDAAMRVASPAPSRSPRFERAVYFIYTIRLYFSPLKSHARRWCFLSFGEYLFIDIADCFRRAKIEPGYRLNAGATIYFLLARWRGGCYSGWHFIAGE